MTARLDAETGLARAAMLLREGGTVAFPTETVYGLGADATNGRALAAVFAAKGRPRFNPLIVHVEDVAAASGLARLTPLARALAGVFWPGPLTLVLERTPDCPVHALASAGLASLALRVPAHRLARALLAAAGRPIAAPSANRSGRLSPTTACHVLAELDGRIDAVLDGGACAVGLESTVIDARGERPVLLRPGGVPAEAVARVAGPLLHPGAGDALASPGQLESHYAPGLPIRRGASDVAEDAALLGFGAMPAGASLALNLSAAGDLVEAAGNFFAHLRALDTEARRRGLRAIAVMPIPEDGIGAAINDRLRRAAATKPGASHPVDEAPWTSRRQE